MLKKERFLPFGFGIEADVHGGILGKGRTLHLHRDHTPDSKSGEAKDGEEADPGDSFAGITRCPNPYSVSIEARV